MFYNGFHGDCSETFAIGNVDTSGKALIQAARQCRDEAINACGPGRGFSVIGKTVRYHLLPDTLYFENCWTCTCCLLIHI